MKVETTSKWTGGGEVGLEFTMGGTWEPCYSPPRPEPVNVTFVMDSFEYHKEVMASERGEKGSHPWKNCQHYKRTSPEKTLPISCKFAHDLRVPSGTNACGSYDVAKCDKPLLGWVGYIGGVGQYNPWGTLPDYYEPNVEPDRFIRAPADLVNLNQRAISSMMPGIRSELSIINSIIELKDFRSLGRTLSSIWNTVSGVISRLKGFSTGSTLRQMLHSTADGYLQAKFNILPLLSDIAAVHHAMSVAEERIRTLLRDIGKKQTRHFRVELFEHAGTTVSRGPYLIGPGTGFPIQIGACKWTASAVPKPSIFHSEMQFNYSLTAWEVEHARLLGFLDAVGINLNPAIIWNAIPWSFLVDWVLGVSRYLSTWKTPNLDPKVNITNYCWSIRRSRYIDCQFDNWCLRAYSSNPPITLPRVDETAYRREVGLPSTSSLISSGLSLTEFSLGLALAITRKPRPKRWVYPKYPKPPRKAKG